MRHTQKIFMLFALLVSTACSNQWRESDPGISAGDMLSLLAEAQPTGGNVQSTGSGSDAISAAMTLKDDPNTVIYFADAPGSSGPVSSVLGLGNMDFLNIGEGLSWQDFSQARIFFLDGFTTSGRQGILLLGLVQNGVAAPAADPTAAGAQTSAFTYYGFQGSISVSGGTFTASLTGSNGAQINLHSDDVDGDQLMDVVQMRVYAVDGSGTEQYIGKFSTLTGFAHQ